MDDVSQNVAFLRDLVVDDLRALPEVQGALF
jgi:hypothetical protein